MRTSFLPLPAPQRRMIVRKDPQSLQTQVQGRDNLGLNPGFTAYKTGALDGDP